MKKHIPLLLACLSILIGVLSLVSALTVGKNMEEIVAGERTSLFRPYITVSGTSTAVTSITSGTSTPASAGAYRLFVDTASTTFRGLVVRGVTSQTGNLLEAQNGSGVIVWSVGPDGAASSTASSTINGNLLPGANNSYDIGAFGAAWRDVYVSGTIRASSTLLNSGSVGAPTYSFASDTATGMRIVGVGDLRFVVSAADVLQLTSNGAFLRAGTLNPGANNGFDIGQWNNAWRDVYVSNSVLLGGGSASTTISGNGSILLSGNILPALVNTSNIGSSDLTFRNIFSSGTAFFNNVSSTLITPWSNNSSDIGSLGLAWRNVYVSSSVNVGSGANSSTLSSSGNLTFSGSLLPATNNASDVGAFGTALRNLYVSSTSFLGTVSSTLITPWVNNVSDLGVFGRAWRDVYVSTSVRLGSLGGTSGTLTASFLGLSGASTVIDSATTLSINTLNNQNISFGGNILGNTVNVRDIGSGTNAWRSIYASTSLLVGSNTVTTTINLATNNSSAGIGSCIVLRGTNGTLYYLSVTSTPTTGTGENLAISTASCQ